MSINIILMRMFILILFGDNVVDLLSLIFALKLIYGINKFCMKSSYKLCPGLVRKQI